MERLAWIRLDQLEGASQVVCTPIQSSNSRPERAYGGAWTIHDKGLLKVDHLPDGMYSDANRRLVHVTQPLVCVPRTLPLDQRSRPQPGA